MTGSQSKFDLAVLIPVLNEEEHIAATLEQIYMQDFPMQRLEVVIADGGSTDRTVEAASVFKERFGSMKILENPRRSIAAGLNLGIRNSTAPFVVRLHGHTLLPGRDFLKTVLELFREQDVKCLCRPRSLFPPDVREFEMSVSICRSSFLGRRPSLRNEADFEGLVSPTAAGTMYARDLFESVGFFDESFNAYEDLEYNYRLQQSGVKAYLSGRLKLYYYPGANLQSLWGKMTRSGRGRYLFYKKHNIFAPLQWFSGFAVTVLGALLLLSFLSTPIFEFLKSLIAYYMLVVVISSGILALKEKHIGCLFYGPLIFPTIHFGLGIGFVSGLLDRYTIKARPSPPI